MICLPSSCIWLHHHPRISSRATCMYYEEPAWSWGTELWRSDGAEGEIEACRRGWNPSNGLGTFWASRSIKELHVEPWKRRRKKRMINRQEHVGLWWRDIMWSFEWSKKSTIPLYKCNAHGTWMAWRLSCIHKNKPDKMERNEVSLDLEG